MPSSLARYLIRNFLRKELSDRVGIIFINNREGVERLCDELRRRGILCTYYHAHLSPDEKAARVLSWNEGLTPLIISTSALSLGINNGRLSYVIHIGYNSAASFVEYVQEIGRCGRDPRMAGGDAILITSGTYDYFSLTCTLKLKQLKSVISNNDAVLNFGFWNQNYGCCHYLIYSYFTRDRESVNVDDIVRSRCYNCLECKENFTHREEFPFADEGFVFKLIEETQKHPAPHFSSLLLLAKILAGIIDRSITDLGVYKLKQYGALKGKTVQYCLILISTLILLRRVGFSVEVKKLGNDAHFSVSRYALNILTSNV